MDFDLYLNLTKEDLLGILKTIYLFLDSTRFKKTSAVLREESVSKGYDFEIVSKKLIIRSSSEQSTRSTQTLGMDDDDRSCRLQSYIRSKTESKEELLFYYKEPFTSYTMSSRDIVINVENASTNSKSSYSEKEKFLKINNVHFVKTDQNIRSNGKIYKSQSEPTLSTSSNVCGDIDKRAQVEKERQVLKKKMWLLENDYKKLMGVTTELTAALQTHIMGQSENLNAMLNKCKSIYPELFKKPEDDENKVPKVASSNNVIVKNKVVCVKPMTTDPSSKPLEDIGTVPVIGDGSTMTIEENNNLADNKPEQGSSYATENATEKKPKSVILCPIRNYDFTLQGSSKCSSKNYFELNYERLKTDLTSHNGELQLVLVVALRKAITISEKDLRDSTMNSYMRNDLLNILPTTKSDKKNILETLFVRYNENSVRLQEETSRLINTVASLKLGREYLFRSDDFLISFLVPVLKGTYRPKVVLNSTSEEMLIATVQKLSLKRPHREHMINADLTEYVVKFLTTNHPGLSRYCLEYSTALFMNLSLHRSARERLRPLAKDVIDLLVNLLNTKSDYCMSYVNGAIFSLLWDDQMNQEARRQNLFDLIRRHIRQTDGERRNELEHIIEVHSENAGEEACKFDTTVEPEFEVEMLESELDGSDNSITNEEDVLLKYKLQNVTSLERPATPLKQSTNKSGVCTRAPSMSYCEETMQFYYTPTKAAIFEPVVKTTGKIGPSPFVKKQERRCNRNCVCHFCVGKTAPYMSNNSLLVRRISTYNVPVCYRDNYERFKIRSKESRYSCDCFRLVSEGVEFDKKNNKLENRYHFCSKCQKKHQLDEPHVETCNKNDSNFSSNIVNDGVVDFSFRELDDLSGCQQTRPTNKDGSCYDLVFQSRPRILRTPP